MPQAANYKVPDKRVDFSASESRLFQTGPKTVNLVKIPSTAQNVAVTAGSTLNFVINAPNYDTGISRFMRIRMSGTATVTFPDAAGGGADAWAGQLAFRPLPITAMTNTITTTINNTTITMNQIYRQRLAALCTNCPSVVANSYMSTSPTQMDICTRFSQNLANSGGPFSAYQDGAQGDGVDAPRNNFYILTRTNARSYVIKYDISEPVLCPPFVGDDSYVESLAGINQIQIQYTLRNFLDAFCAESNITNIVTGDTKFELLTSYITAPVGVERPLRLRYNCPKIDYSTFTAPALAAGDQATSSLPYRQLSSIPRYIILWATPTTSYYPSDATSIVKADIILPILGVNISFCNSQGLLADLAPAQLYEISKQSGLNAHYREFIGDYLAATGAIAADDRRKYSGVLNARPLVIDVAQFLQLPENAAVGVRMQTAFNAQVTVKNTLIATGTDGGADAAAAVDLDNGVDIHTLIVYDQELITENGNAALLEGMATEADIKAAQIAPAAAQQAAAATIARAGVYGGSFFDSLLNVGKSVLPVLGNMAGEAVGVPGLGSIASSLLGAGVGSNTGGARLTRGAMHKMQ
jgi:hypothetical protein